MIHLAILAEGVSWYRRRYQELHEARIKRSRPHIYGSMLKIHFVLPYLAPFQYTPRNYIPQSVRFRLNERRRARRPFYRIAKRLSARAGGGGRGGT